MKDFVATTEPAMAVYGPEAPPLDANVIPIPTATARKLPPTRLLLSFEGILWLAVAAVMFTAGLVKGINLLILLAYLLLGLWVINWRLVRRDLRRLRGRRLPPGPIFAGADVEVRVELSVEGGRIVRGVIVEEPGPERSRRWMVLRLSAVHSRIHYRECFATRGRQEIGPIRAASRFPFGLFGRTIELIPAQRWLVLPRLGRLHVERFKHWLAKTTRGDGRLRRRQSHTALQEADIHGLRDFRTGDNPRWIHWRSSARRNQLLVREFEAAAHPELVLIVEAWLPEPAMPVHAERLEQVISLAATLCREWCRDPFNRLTLIISGADVVVMPTGGGTEYAASALEHLAEAPGGSGRPAHEWAQRAPRLRAAASIVVLTSRDDSTLAGQVEAIVGRQAGTVLADDQLAWYEPPLAPRQLT